MGGDGGLVSPRFVRRSFRADGWIGLRSFLVPKRRQRKAKVEPTLRLRVRLLGWLAVWPIVPGGMWQLNLRGRGMMLRGPSWDAANS